MTVTTSYANKDNPNNLDPGFLQQSRIVYFLRDIIRNYFSDPNNIKDERMVNLMYPAGLSGDSIAKLFRVALPYSAMLKTECETPSVAISLGGITYGPAPLNVSAAGAINSPMGTAVRKAVFKRIALGVSVSTESYIGTIQLTELLEMWLKMNEDNIVASCKAISELHTTEVSMPAKVPTGEQKNAKDIYQSTIGLYVVGGLSWTCDTQGPVFRGLSSTVNVKE